MISKGTAKMSTVMPAATPDSSSFVFCAGFSDGVRFEKANSRLAVGEVMAILHIVYCVMRNLRFLPLGCFAQGCFATL